MKLTKYFFPSKLSALHLSASVKLVASLWVVVLVGCGSSKDQPKSATNASGSAKPGSSLESSDGSEDSATGSSDATGQQDPLNDQEYWAALIRLAEERQAASIAMDAPVTATMLGDLRRVPKLVELLIDKGIVDDSGLTAICEGLPELEHLRIRLSPIGDEGARQIAKLKQIRMINIPQCKITAAGIESWSELQSLNHVRLGGNQLNDAAMAALAKIPNLQSLHLIGPSITAEGIQHIAQASKLSSLYLDDCQLSDEVWQKLRKARPDIHVHLDQQHRDRR